MTEIKLKYNFRWKKVKRNISGKSHFSLTRFKNAIENKIDNKFSIINSNAIQQYNKKWLHKLIQGDLIKRWYMSV